MCLLCIWVIIVGIIEIIELIIINKIFIIMFIGIIFLSINNVSIGDIIGLKKNIKDVRLVDVVFIVIK